MFSTREKRSKKAEVDPKKGEKREDNGVKRGDDAGAAADRWEERTWKEGSRLPELQSSLKD